MAVLEYLRAARWRYVAGVVALLYCVDSAPRRDAATVPACGLHAIDVAVAAAGDALRQRDGAALDRWYRCAPQTVEGARIIHFWAEHQERLGRLDEAEHAYRQALLLRVDRDPPRAANTALALVALGQSRRPAEDTLRLAQIARQQAALGDVPLARALASGALVELMLELGELRAAEQILGEMDAKDAPALYAIAQGQLMVARGRPIPAAESFAQAAAATADAPSWQAIAYVELAHARINAGDRAAARDAIAAAKRAIAADGEPATSLQVRLAAAVSRAALAAGDPHAALAALDRGLALPSRDAARVLLLSLRGDARAAAGDRHGAERAWREAADVLEDWRASLPSDELRGGIVVHQRHALEAWLESAARHGDVDGVLEATQRLIGRGLTDRLRDRRVAVGAVAELTIREVIARLAQLRADTAPALGQARTLREAARDFVAIVRGARSVWVVRRLDRRWSIARAGDREHVLALVRLYRDDPDDAAVARALGDALFPIGTLPIGDRPLAVLLDHAFAEVLLAGLRPGGQYIVERAPIIELLAPELLFADLPDRAWEPAVCIADPDGTLPGSFDELELAGCAPRDTYDLDRATRVRIARAGNTRLLHVSLHSEVVDGRAALQLRDGPFSAPDIVALKLAPRVAFLSSCASHTSDDPVSSLAAAFLAAGTSAVIGTKRSIEDEPPSLVVKQFYAHGGAESPALGLARAQRDAIAAGLEPSAWALYSCFGVGGWLAD